MKFLNETGGGVVSKIVSGSLVYVATTDGFELPTSTGDIIKMEAEKGKTIILASHILDEVEKVCSHVGVLKWGQLIASGKVNELLKEDDTIIIEAERLGELHELLVRAGFVNTIEQNDTEMLVTLADKKTAADLNDFAFKNGFTLSRLEVRKQSLESQFLELVR